ncbi:MAG: cation:proton antiporter regulatory subunit [Eubacteriaceae bacterium]
MQIKTSDLPGIGMKHTIITASGDNIIILTHYHGQRDIYHFDDLEDDMPTFSLELNDDEARKIGTILLGVDYQPVTEEREECFSQEIRIHWFDVKPNSCLANMTIKEAQIRKRTGVTILGIKRGHDFIGSPDPTEMILVNDKLMVTGKKDPIKRLESMCSSINPE